MLSDSQRIGQLENEVARLTAVVDELTRQLGVTVPDSTGVPSLDDPPADVLDAIDAGNLIFAIKLWRDRTGSSLADAKSHVEAIAAERGR